jgi:FAD/FMN-containing dehydrogenase
VTIDLGSLVWTRFNADSETVDIGPGGRWKDVYTELAKHNRAVAGGREGNVGVAGLILGGGNTFYTARHGFACDNVVAFEVVLADGRIVVASGTDAQTKDLYWALKGGSSNFGIVTNFCMRALKSSPVWGGLTFFPPTVTPEASQALVSFADNMHKDVDSNLLCFFAYTGTFTINLFSLVNEN